MAVSLQCCPLRMLGILALLVCTASGSYEHTCSLSTRSRGPHPSGLCGDHLSQIVSLVCGNSGYVDKVYHKRSAPTQPDPVGEKLRGILLNKRDALSYLQKRVTRGVRRRGRNYGSQGITCECCYNMCTYNELLQYCNS